MICLFCLSWLQSLSLYDHSCWRIVQSANTKIRRAYARKNSNSNELAFSDHYTDDCCILHSDPGWYGIHSKSKDIPLSTNLDTYSGATHPDDVCGNPFYRIYRRSWSCRVLVRTQWKADKSSAIQSANISNVAIICSDSGSKLCCIDPSSETSASLSGSQTIKGPTPVVLFFYSFTSRFLFSFFFSLVFSETEALLLFWLSPEKKYHYIVEEPGSSTSI